MLSIFTQKTPIQRVALAANRRIAQEPVEGLEARTQIAGDALDQIATTGVDGPETSYARVAKVALKELKSAGTQLATDALQQLGAPIGPFTASLLSLREKALEAGLSSKGETALNHSLLEAVYHNGDSNSSRIVAVTVTSPTEEKYLTSQRYAIASLAVESAPHLSRSQKTTKLALQSLEKHKDNSEVVFDIIDSTYRQLDKDSEQDPKAAAFAAVGHTACQSMLLAQATDVSKHVFQKIADGLGQSTEELLSLRDRVLDNEKPSAVHEYTVNKAVIDGVKKTGTLSEQLTVFGAPEAPSMFQTENVLPQQRAILAKLRRA